MSSRFSSSIKKNTNRNKRNSLYQQKKQMSVSNPMSKYPTYDSTTTMLETSRSEIENDEEIIFIENFFREKYKEINKYPNESFIYKKLYVLINVFIVIINMRKIEIKKLTTSNLSEIFQEKVKKKINCIKDKKDNSNKITLKHDNIIKILSLAKEFGIVMDQIVVDGLVTTVGANRYAALETLDTIRYCRDQLGLCTTAGLSNISFGLPERPYVNGAFLTMALQSGLTMAIANPSDSFVMGLGLAADLLRNKKDADIRYIHKIKHMDILRPKENAKLPVKGSKDISGDKGEDKSADRKKHSDSEVYQAVLKGNRKGILRLVDESLSRGHTAKQILDEMLIPGINEVGRLFEIQEYFLPQLISSATAMEEAIKYLEPKLQDGKNQEEKPVLVIATVEGDIHDIGKNLVALMLRNYGYQVIDLGKDVPADRIIETAEKENASVIVLSALMTTTMMKMKDVISLRNRKNLSSKVIIGGAVTTQEFADEIGADGYSGDASEAVRLVDRLLGVKQ